MRVLELYCGIGGCAAALDGVADVTLAVDTNRRALAVYGRNFAHPAAARSIEGVGAEELLRLNADLWWMSPPCQPYTRRGLRRDLDDPRAASFVALLERIREVGPRYVALENVPEFADSRACARLRGVLEQCGYQARTLLLCPSELGMPNRRRRFYLVAGLEPLLPWPALTGEKRLRLVDALDPHPDPSLWLAPDIVRRYEHALDRVDPSDPAARTSCFTASYGRAIIRSGSYLLTPRGLRRFSPAEILRLLGFPSRYTLPPDLTDEQAWPLAGNSLSVPAVRYVLSALPPAAT
ncbi:MAG: DNA cytosine methyltransferase [Planctomycetes bacterium]|nr:DNA cytosine methyltransferase [Planctomycetota bacterium]